MPPYVLVWLLLIFAWAANFVIRIGFSALLPSIMSELSLSYTRAGLLASAFFYAYVIMQIPSGLLGDRYGRRRILLQGLLGGALSAGLTGLAGSFAALFTARALTGAFQGSLFSNDRAIIATVTPPDRIGLGQGVSFAGPGLGLTAGLVMGGLLVEVLPWRTVMMLFGLGPIAAALLIARFVPSPAPSTAQEPLGRRLGGLFANGPLWLLALASLCAIANQFILATWAPLFFQEAGITDVGRAGIYAALQGIAASLGMIVGGFTHDRLARRGFESKTVIVAGLAALALSMLAMAAVIAQRSVPALAILVFLAAFFCWSIWGAVYTLLGRMVRAEDLGAAFGWSNSISFLGAIVGPIATGWARDLTGSFSAGCLLAAVLAAAGVALVGGVRAPRQPVLAPAERRG
ncbi:MAG TPA: MFS transporter [Methylomirabilota bacterium]|nr:MFS transporter [Methylomirabilota bacterium]